MTSVTKLTLLGMGVTAAAGIPVVIRHVNYANSLGAKFASEGLSISPTDDEVDLSFRLNRGSAKHLQALNGALGNLSQITAQSDVAKAREGIRSACEAWLSSGQDIPGQESVRKWCTAPKNRTVGGHLSTLENFEVARADDYSVLNVRWKDVDRYRKIFSPYPNPDDNKLQAYCEDKLGTPLLGMGNLEETILNVFNFCNRKNTDASYREVMGD